MGWNCRRSPDAIAGHDYVIFLPQEQRADRVLGLELGADDYIPKRSVRELVAIQSCAAPV
jgi:DNA-binding response OmpR family regulator